MNFEIKIAFLLILVFGLKISSNRQTITFNILKKMIDCRKCKDSIIQSWKFIKGARILAPYFIVESESYMSLDSSKIISTGKTERFRKTTLLVDTSPNSTSYFRGKYLQTLNNNASSNSKSSVALVRNYQPSTIH